jgi:hypothetical protein
MSLDMKYISRLPQLTYKLTPELIVITPSTYKFMCTMIWDTFYKDNNKQDEFNTFLNIFNGEMVVYFGIPYNGENLLLHSINHNYINLFDNLIKNKIQIKGHCLFAAIAATHNSFHFLRMLIENGANPYFKLNNTNLLEHADNNRKYACGAYLYSKFGMRK